MNKQGVYEAILWLFVGGFLLFVVWLFAFDARMNAGERFCYPYVMEDKPRHVQLNEYIIKCGDGLHNGTFIQDACAKTDEYGLCKKGTMFIEVKNEED